MAHWRTGVIVGLVLIAVGVEGLTAGWGLDWWDEGPMRGPMMRGFGGHP